MGRTQAFPLGGRWILGCEADQKTDEGRGAVCFIVLSDLSVHSIVGGGSQDAPSCLPSGGRWPSDSEVGRGTAKRIDIWCRPFDLCLYESFGAGPLPGAILSCFGKKGFKEADSRGRCRRSKSNNVPFAASSKFHLLLCFSSPHKGHSPLRGPLCAPAIKAALLKDLPGPLRRNFLTA